MTITGDLTVLGSSTEISSTELRIEDKLITVVRGSVRFSIRWNKV